MSAAFAPGTRVEFAARRAGQIVWEPARIEKPRRKHLPLPGPDWRIIRFPDGGGICCHESGLRVAPR